MYMPNSLGKVFSINNIKIQKFLEMSQYVFISYWIGNMCGAALDAACPELDETKPLWHTFIEVSLQLMALTIIIYLVKQVSDLLPFCCKYTSNYVPGKFGENTTGLIMGAGLVFTVTQVNLKAKMVYLTQQFQKHLPFGSSA